MTVKITVTPPKVVTPPYSVTISGAEHLFSEEDVIRLRDALNNALPPNKRITPASINHRILPDAGEWHPRGGSISVDQIVANHRRLAAADNLGPAGDGHPQSVGGPG